MISWIVSGARLWSTQPELSSGAERSGSNACQSLVLEEPITCTTDRCLLPQESGTFFSRVRVGLVAAGGMCLPIVMQSG